MGHVGTVAVQKILVNMASNNVTTSAYLQLDASLDEHTSFAEIFNGSGEVLFLATGASGAEQAMFFYILPGGNGRIPLILNQGVRLSVKSATNNVTSGYLAINLWV